MKILIIHCKSLPVYNSSSKGAIEKLLRIYLEYNERKKDKIVVYSPKISATEFDKKKLKNTIFRSIDLTSSSPLLLAEKLYYALQRRIERSNTNRRYISKIIKDLKDRQEENDYDLIIFENGVSDISYFVNKIKTNAKIIEHLHNDYINKSISGSDTVIDCCDEIWTVSGFLSKRVNEVRGAKTIVIPNTIGDAIRTKNAATIKIYEKKYDTSKNTIFLYVGRILNSKGVPELLKSFERYHSYNPASKLIVIGESDNNKQSKETERLLTRKAAKNKDIHQLGYVSPNEIINYQAISDCQIIPTICEEAFGLVVLEAMNANLKIIASKSGGIPEIGKHKIQYVNRGDIVNELFLAMKRIDKQKMPKNYYEDILSEYTEKSFCEKMYEAIHEKR